MEEAKLQYLEPKQKVGLIVVITGQGKGKTTAALGMALRSAGHNMKVCIIHFMKDDMYSGEMDGVKRLAPHVELHPTGKGFCGIMGNPYPYKEHRANAQEAIRLTKEKMFSGNFDILITERQRTGGGFLCAIDSPLFSFLPLCPCQTLLRFLQAPLTALQRGNV